MGARSGKSGAAVGSHAVSTLSVVAIAPATHPMSAELRRRQESAKAIEIGSDVWVGGGAILCSGVRVGARSVIGAGSVVTRDVPEGVFAAGNPCRVIRAIPGAG